MTQIQEVVLKTWKARAKAATESHRKSRQGGASAKHTDFYLLPHDSSRPPPVPNGTLQGRPCPLPPGQRHRRPRPGLTRRAFPRSAWGSAGCGGSPWWSSCRSPRTGTRTASERERAARMRAAAAPGPPPAGTRPCPAHRARVAAEMRVQPPALVEGGAAAGKRADERAGGGRAPDAAAGGRGRASVAAAAGHGRAPDAAAAAARRGLAPRRALHGHEGGHMAIPTPGRRNGRGGGGAHARCVEGWASARGGRDSVLRYTHAARRAVISRSVIKTLPLSRQNLGRIKQQSQTGCAWCWGYSLSSVELPTNGLCVSARSWEGRADVIYQGWCEALGMVLHHVLIFALGRKGSENGTVRWVRNRLDGHKLRIFY